MTVKLIITGRRRPGQTLAAHRHHMRLVHGQMVLDYIAQDPDHAPRRYVQNQVFDGWFAPDSPARDFATELWFPDMAAVGPSRQTEFYRTHLQPDEPNMVDEASVQGMVTREGVVRPGARGAIKVIHLHRAAPGVSREEFDRAWSEMPAPGLGLHARAHVLTPGPADGVDLFWLADAAAAEAFARGPARDHAAALAAQGLTAPDSGNLLIAQEYVLFAGPGALQGGVLE